MKFSDRITFKATSRAAWRKWLTLNHDSAPHVWLISCTKAAGKPRVSYEEAVEEALCFGWIDSRPNLLDAGRYTLLFTPRKEGGAWSALNKRRVEKLIATSLMAPAGLAKVEAARLDGSWNGLDKVESLVVPGDLATALQQHQAARDNFEAFSHSSKKIIVGWIHSAKRPDTRARRIAQAVEMAARNLKANHYPR